MVIVLSLPRWAMSDALRPQAADSLRFLRAWASAPLRTAALAPSGPHLARAVARAVDPALPGLVVEFGPGTGAVTAALLERGVAEERLLLIESNPDFARLLRDRYRGAQVLEGDAYTSPSRLAADGVQLAAAVSGLPLVQQPMPRRLRFVRALLRLAGEGPFVQITYGLTSPVPLRRGLVGEASPRIWLNVGPARVWRYRLAR